MEMNDTILHEGGHDDISGNAPMIPRKEVIAIINDMQLLTTRCLILLNKYEPEHFKHSSPSEASSQEPDTKQAEIGSDKISEPVWSSSSTGHPDQSHVHTLT